VTVHNTGWLDDRQVHHGSFDASLILDPVDVEKHTGILYHLMTNLNYMFNLVDGMKRASAEKVTQCKEDLYLAMKFARQTLSTKCAEVTPMTTIRLISAHILHPFRKLWSFATLDNAMDINPEDKTSYIAQYEKAFLEYVENKYCAKNAEMSINKPENVPGRNLFPSAKASGFGESTFDPYDISSDGEQDLTPQSVADTKPAWNNCAARILTAAVLYLNPLPDAPLNWGLVNPYLNDYHSDPMEIRDTTCIPDITDWWCHQEEMQLKYADLSNVTCDMSSITRLGVRVEVSFSLGPAVIGWRESEITGQTLREKVSLRQYARVNHSIVVGHSTAFDTTETENDLGLKKDVVQSTLHRMAKAHNLIEMWQGSQTLCALQKKARHQNKQMTAIGCISDMEVIVKATWWLFQPDGAAAFTLSERAPLPPAVLAKDIPGGWTQVINVRRIRRLDRHPAESDKASAHECISNTENLL